MIQPSRDVGQDRVFTADVSAESHRLDLLNDFGELLRVVVCFQPEGVEVGKEPRASVKSGKVELLLHLIEELDAEGILDPQVETSRLLREPVLEFLEDVAELLTAQD